jgi:hypothetical protein
MALKPEVSLTLAVTTGALVWGIFQSHLPPTADVRANQNNNAVESTRKVATMEAIVVVSGISLLCKDPNIFIVGGAMTAIESWIRMHASYVSPATNKVAAPAVSGQSANSTGAAPASPSA